MGRKKNVSSEISKNTKIKAANDADEVKKSDSEVQKCKLHPPAISLPSSSHTTTTHPLLIQTCSNIQNSELRTIPSPNTPLPSSVEVSVCESSYEMTNPCNRLMALRTIFIPQQPTRSNGLELFFLQMSRNGWTELHRYYNKKFGYADSRSEVKLEENRERRRIATCLADTCTLSDTTVYINLRDKLFSKTKEISEKEIGKLVVRTRKHPNELVDSKVLDLINRVVGEYAGAHVPESITEAAYIMQAAQVCYDEATRKEKPRFAWKKNIESKISKLVLSKDLLEKARKQEKLSTSESKSLKKIMREFNLNLSSVTDLSEALVMKNESLNVYEKKIAMHESRKQFRKENRMFELFRGRFYRGLSERVESEHVVSRDEIVSFWSTMWNKNDKVVMYDDYLIPFVSDNQAYYRPITCMFNFYKLTTKCVTKFVQLEVERRGLLAENQLGAVRGLTQCIENLNLPDWIMKFIKVIISKWEIDISVGPEKIMSKKIDRGILQGDNPSPLLFVLCMDPLSRKLNEKYTKVTVQTDAESHSTNLLLFIDDLKLLAKDSSTLRAMTGEAKEFLEVIGLEINKEKSATNDTCVSVYKYLGIIEDSRGIQTRSSFEEVQSKLIARLEDAVRAVLVKNKIHLRPGYKDRLHSVELRSEHMLLQRLDCLEKSKEILTRRAAILKVENNNKTHLALIKGFLKLKYRLVEESKLYNARKNELVSVTKKRNIRPRNEAVCCFIQDRNVFWGADNHLTTRCEKMLGNAYIKRHNEVVRCLHLLFLNRYKSHSVQEILNNEYAEIRVDTKIKTDVKIRNNRPNLYIFDKKKNKISLIEVGITSQDLLHIVETEKIRKYDLLVNDLCFIWQCSLEIISHGQKIQITMNIEAYFLSIVLKKTVETISFDRRRGLEASMGVIMRSEMHEEQTPPSKEAKKEEDGAKNLTPKNNTHLISQGGTTLKESTNT
ncbi:reverse transcriptase [Hamiltosporidium tvaerminnensis]|uniref:Reverse transcriptase n=1 Tax=Hamiltosporidium tvaerminnensis TaxID=1176355 RepID=A0A4Q9M2F9_9MICR|nr:reverse transcriptase [Hamiltosporidium tvaerminnensis]